MKYSALLIGFLLCFAGCKKTDNNALFYDSSSIIINAGFYCGWGAGADSLFISRSEIKYLYYVPAESMLPKIIRSRSVPDTEWINIVNSIDLKDFIKLKYNSCNVCVDGCDEWISVQTDQISHQIRFSKGLRIDTIYKLQNKIEQLRSEFGR
jgi:hypothetical protein